MNQVQEKLQRRPLRQEKLLIYRVEYLIKKLGKERENERYYCEFKPSTGDKRILIKNKNRRR
jgi:hypothetical protein